MLTQWFLVIFDKVSETTATHTNVNVTSHKCMLFLLEMVC